MATAEETTEAAPARTGARLQGMSSLMTNIRKISLQEGPSAIGRLLLQLGQAADSTLDAETLAELDKQAAVAACQALDAADGDGGEGEEPGDEGNPEEPPASSGDAEASSTKEEGGVREESSTATTVELSADCSQHGGDIGSNNSSSHHPQAGGGDPTSTSAPPSLMHASSSVHSTTSSHAAAAAAAAPSPTTSSSSLFGPRHNGAPSPLPRSARSSREASLVFSGGILSAPAAATQPKEPEPPSSSGAAPTPPAAAPRDLPAENPSASEGPVTVVLQGFDSEDDDKLVVCESKALAHLFTRIRNRETPPHAFRFYASRMMRILAEEVS